LSQSLTLLIRERGKSTPFSTHLRINESFDMPVEQFFAALRLENREKFEDLRLEIDSNTLETTQ
jgi:hypothetical protein